LDLDFAPIFIFTIANLENPSSATVISDATIGSYNSGSLFDTDTIDSFTYTAVTISTCGLSSSSTTSGELATLTLNCDITNDIPSGGVIIFTTPKWVDSDYGASVPVTMLDQISGCAAAEDIVGNSPGCVATIDSATDATQDYVTITDAFSTTGGASAGDTVEITISNFLNPPSTTALSDFEIEF
jgi:hypothetical protein